MDPTAMLTLKPIGYMKSVFHFKNGTPRQSSLCENARGILTIEKSVFNNPEHSLDGLQHFSHAWILFMFHKNNNAHKKAKVKPPRLDGQRVGVFSTRSPYRPNNVGLSLAKIDKIQGASIHFSGIDILDGTPIIDIKPYIPDYDKPTGGNDESSSNMFPLSASDSSEEGVNVSSTDGTKTIADTNLTESSDYLSDPNATSKASAAKKKEFRLNDDTQTSTGVKFSNNASLSSSAIDSTFSDTPRENSDYCENSNESSDRTDTLAVSSLTGSSLQCEDVDRDNEGEEDDILDFLVGDVICRAASDVLLTDKDNVKAKNSLEIDGDKNCDKKKTVPINEGETTNGNFVDRNNSAVTAPWLSSPPVAKVRVIFSVEALQQLQGFHSDATDPRFKTEMLSTPEDARNAITSILHEEPRSVYRRQKCQNSVYFFALDVLHVTCWFDGDAVTVLRIKPAADVPQLQEKGAFGKVEKDKH